MIYSALFTLLSAASGVTALIGTGSSIRLWPGIVRQGSAYPAVVYNEIDEVRDETFGGPTLMPDSRWQLDVYDATYEGAAAVSEALRAALDGYVGTVPVDGQSIVSLRMLDRRGPTIEPDTQLFRVSTDFGVWFRES